MTNQAPVVSVIIANFNGAQFLPDALASALNQTISNIEVIIVDDASTDRSVEIIHALKRKDDRIRLIQNATRSGPGGARNKGLEAANGRWIAILDGDDLMHPARLETLVHEAETRQADICADDLLVFGEGLAPAPLLSARQRSLGWVSAAAFIASNELYAREPALGYLKPLIRRSFLREHAISYDETLQIGEDYDLIVKLLSKGARFRLIPALSYFYRKHGHSISHRMVGDHVRRMLAADDRLCTLFSDDCSEVRRAFARRRASLTRAAAYDSIIAALKNRRWWAAIANSLRHPRALPLLRMPLAARLGQVFATASKQEPREDKRICLISRQRLVGSSNGSSNYLLSLMTALREAGHQITLISPSTATFGRMPFLRLRPEMSIFDEIHVRGAWRIGKHLYIAKDPRIALSAAAAILGRFLSRFGITIPSLDRPAPYAVAAPWTREDYLYIAQKSPRRAHIVLADYAFTTPALPYALLPSARTAVVMHDFFSARAERFREQQLADSVASLDQAGELNLFRQADAVIAIQNVEAAEIARLLPDRQVFVAPLAARVVAEPQVGDRRTLLFVGSNTAPNVIGLQWFFRAVWPQITNVIPDVELLLAGTVASTGVAGHVSKVKVLGLVPDLDPLYARAGVVISPLTVGSGLKIKLIEALGQGKAIVATRVTTEGCEGQVVQSIFECDDASDFANAVIRLLSNDALRLRKACEALAVARRLYAPEACYGDLLKFADRSASPQHAWAGSTSAHLDRHAPSPALAAQARCGR